MFRRGVGGFVLAVLLLLDARACVSILVLQIYFENKGEILFCACYMAVEGSGWARKTRRNSTSI